MYTAVLVTRSTVPDRPKCEFRVQLPRFVATCINTLHKGDSIIIIIIISKSFRKYVSTIPGNHGVRELQKTVILGTAHILRKVLM
jgi:hypothetical protein